MIYDYKRSTCNTEVAALQSRLNGLKATIDANPGCQRQLAETASGELGGDGVHARNGPAEIQMLQIRRNETLHLHNVAAYLKKSHQVPRHNPETHSVAEYNTWVEAIAQRRIAQAARPRSDHSHSYSYQLSHDRGGYER